MGRPSLPPEVLALHGSSEIGRSRAQEKPSFKAGRPSFPKSDLPPEALPVWKDVVKSLAKRGTLTKGDKHQLTLYCRTFLQWKSACAVVEKEGVMVSETRASKSGELYEIRTVNPCCKLAADLYSELQASLKEMGLTGQAKDKVKPVGPPQEKKPEYPFGTYGYYRAHAAEFDPEVDLTIPADLEMAEEKKVENEPAKES